MSKVCIVTGASRGMGRGISKVLAQDEGATVYATARSQDALNELTASLEDAAGTIHPVVLDQGDDDAVWEFVAMVASNEVGIDLLVNSAYGGLVAMTPHFGKPFWERPISVFDASLNIGLRSAYVISAAVAPHMVRQKFGLMVQVSSLGGYTYLFDVGYGVGKAGLDRLSADMAAELKPHGVHSITLYPGGAVTEIAAFPGGETTTFAGRAVAALLNRTSSEELDRINGKVIQTMELALQHGFTDASGSLPDGPFSSQKAAEGTRALLKNTPVQYNLDGALPDAGETNNPEVAAFFPGV